MQGRVNLEGWKCRHDNPHYCFSPDCQISERILCGSCAEQVGQHAGHKVLSQEAYSRVRKQVVKEMEKEKLEEKMERFMKEILETKTHVDQIWRKMNLMVTDKLGSLNMLKWELKQQEQQQIYGEIISAAREKYIVLNLFGDQTRHEHRVREFMFLDFSLLSDLSRQTTNYLSILRQLERRAEVLLGQRINWWKAISQNENITVINARQIVDQHIHQRQFYSQIRQNPPARSRQLPSSSSLLSQSSFPRRLSGDSHALLGSFPKAPSWTFSSMKSESIKIAKDYLTIFRSKQEPFGITVYAMIAPPISEINSTIKLAINHVSDARFVYFGFGKTTMFEQRGYEGKLYGLGDGMVAIRQNGNLRRSAVTLHHSLKDYSNREIVGWDMECLDEIEMGINFRQKAAFWRKKGEKEFKMPIETDITWHFFVGLKGINDSISII